MYELDLPKHDLRAMARLLEKQFRDRPPVGAVVGKTMMRDAIVTTTGCSVLDAETLVDQLEELGYLSLRQPPRVGGVRRSRPTWQISASPLTLN